MLGTAAAALISYRLKQRRRQELAAMAGQLGLDLSPDDPLGCLGLPFALLARGDGRGVENVLWGTWQGLPVRQFDQRYYEESIDAKGRRSRTSHRYSCAVTEIEATFPPLTIDRENLLTRLVDGLGLDDIGFEPEGFNRAFDVKAEDRKFAYDCIDQRMKRWLLEASPGYRFEACGPWLLDATRRLRPTQLIPLLGTLKGFRDRVPRVVPDLYPRRAVG